MAQTAASVRESIAHYYGAVLKTSADLKTSACCCATDELPDDVKACIARVHPDVLASFYGCGSPLPALLSGLRLLDIGCGTGRDVYVASQLIGPSGFCTGLDMTPSQLDVAEKHLSFHMDAFGYGTPNVAFKHGLVEDLRASGIGDGSLDLVISNCVLNLSTDKAAAFTEIHRTLCPGGEFFFSDVYCDRRLPASVAEDPILRGECLGGALYLGDFKRVMAAAGFRDVRVMSSRAIEVSDPALRAALGAALFTSVTTRAFKLPFEDAVCEDFGQTGQYLGTIPGHEHAFDLDDGHTFVTGRRTRVCGNTALMLTATRFASHFSVTAAEAHLGLFVGCGPVGGACC